MMFLPEGKTYFIMKDGSTLPFYRAVLDIIPKIYVYNRESSQGTECLNLRNLKSIIVEGTEEYEERAKKFITFIHTDLADNQELKEVISCIWNGDQLYDLISKGEQIFPECYVEDYDKYLIELRNKYDDVDFLSYYYEKYFLQECIYPKYSENWLENFDGPVSSSDQITIDDEGEW